MPSAAGSFIPEHVKAVSLSLLLILSPFLIAGCSYLRIYHDELEQIKPPPVVMTGVRADIARETPVVAAAFIDALRAQGYAIASKNVNASRARIVARTDSRSMTVTVRTIEGGCRVSVGAGSGNNRDDAAFLLRAALARLGLL